MIPVKELEINSSVMTTSLNAQGFIPVGSDVNIHDFGLDLHYPFSPDTTSVSNVATASASALPVPNIDAGSAALTIGSVLNNQCPHGCNGTFSQSGEYRCHMKKHADHQHVCGQPGCGRSFYRKDKLREHLWQKHRIETRASARNGRHYQQTE
jgi:hypothetical protein